jgi:hypothetical protein
MRIARSAINRTAMLLMKKRVSLISVTAVSLLLILPFRCCRSCRCYQCCCCYLAYYKCLLLRHLSQRRQFSHNEASNNDNIDKVKLALAAISTRVKLARSAISATMKPALTAISAISKRHNDNSALSRVAYYHTIAQHCNSICDLKVTLGY